MYFWETDRSTSKAQGTAYNRAQKTVSCVQQKSPSNCDTQMSQLPAGEISTMNQPARNMGKQEMRENSEKLR